MATTTNFGWETPDDTDLVKDGALAMRTLGNSIDSSFVDLKGGTTGQVLAKASNTDLDYTWVTQDDANAIQNAIVDAKGDLIAASAADVPARLAVGNNGETLVADSSTSTGLRWQADWNTGKNKIINGNFNIWQRGTSINVVSGVDNFFADRFAGRGDAPSGTPVVTRQTFTPGAAPVAGYEGQFFLRYTTGGNITMSLAQAIEDVRTLAGQTVTVSFWAKSSTAKTFTMLIRQSFGTGGSPIVDQTATYTTSTSWQRFTQTFNLASVSGKTIGANSFLLFQPIAYSAQTGNFDYDIWGVQVEAGSVATPFTTATGTLAGELAACQRYYVRFTTADAYSILGMGGSQSTTQAKIICPLPVTMRTKPASVDYSTLGLAEGGGAIIALTALTLEYHTIQQGSLLATVASGLTAQRPIYLFTNNSSSAFLGFSAEL